MQLTPTATIRGCTPTAIAASIGSPAEVDEPSRHEYPSQAGIETSSMSRTSTSASRTVGIVSKASRSAPASTSASIRGR